MVGRIERILFQNGPFFVAEYLRTSAHKCKELAVKAGNGLKACLKRDIQNAVFGAGQKAARVLNTQNTDVLQRSLMETVLE